MVAFGDLSKKIINTDNYKFLIIKNQKSNIISGEIDEEGVELLGCGALVEVFGARFE